MVVVDQPAQITSAETESSDYLRALGYNDFSIEVNDQCNFHCNYCPYDTDESHEFAVMDQGKAKEIIDQLAADEALDGYLLFNVLGEPLMYNGLCDLIKYANNAGLKTKVVTNGSLLTSKNIAALIDAGPTLLKISVESLDAAVFAELRGTTIRFETYIGRISNMIARALEVGSSFRSYLQLDLIYADAKVHALNRMCGIEAEDKGRTGLYSNKRKLNRDLAVFLNQLIDTRGVPTSRLENRNRNPAAYNDNAIPLVSISPKIGVHIKTYYRWDDMFARKYPVDDDGRGCDVDNLAVHADGRVVLCCVDYNASTTIGNVFKQSLPEIMADPRNIKIIKDLRKGKFFFDGCKSCQGHTTFLGKYVFGTVRQKTTRRVLGAVKRKTKALARKS